MSSGKIFYADGFEQQANVLINEYENVSDTIFEVSCTNNTVYFCDIEGIENVLNLENIAMLELPFYHSKTKSMMNIFVLWKNSLKYGLHFF